MEAQRIEILSQNDFANFNPIRKFKEKLNTQIQRIIESTDLKKN